MALWGQVKYVITVDAKQGLPSIKKIKWTFHNDNKYIKNVHKWTHSSVNYHFPHKDNLWNFIISECFNWIKMKLENINPSSVNPSSQIIFSKSFSTRAKPRRGLHLCLEKWLNRIVRSGGTVGCDRSLSKSVATSDWVATQACEGCSIFKHIWRDIDLWICYHSENINNTNLSQNYDLNHILVLDSMRDHCETVPPDQTI